VVALLRPPSQRGLRCAAARRFPSRDATIERYRERTGFAVEHLGYYEIFAAFRFAVIMIRVLRQLVAAGMLPAEFENDNTATRMLAKLVDGR